MKTKPHSPIETLEARIAPAAVFTFTDVDGDLVTVKTSKGTNPDLAAIVTLVPEGIGNELQRINFSLNPAVFNGTNLSVTAKRTAAGGDGLVNVGYVDASSEDGGTSFNLGIVTIRGDLGRIGAGAGSTAVKALSVQSMGQFGTSTQEAGGDLVSTIIGTLGSLKVAGNVQGAGISVRGGVEGKIGLVTIGGSLIGRGGPFTGSIFSEGAMGAVKIGGDIVGSSHAKTGSIESSGTLAGVTVGGSLIGGGDTSAGRISSFGAMGPVKIGGSIEGGTGVGSGSVTSSRTIASVTVGGSLLGGTTFGSGSISSSRATGPVTVGGSIISGTVSGSGAIQAGDSIGPITVKGSLVGTGTNPVLITARGQATPGVSTDVAIRSLTVGGRVEFADILAGYEPGPFAVNGDAQIGPVKVGGDWIASNLVAGVQDNADAPRNDFFGDGDDQKIAAGSSTIISKIASILINGTVLGTVGGVDHFGFVAQHVASVKIGATTFPLTSGSANDLAGLPAGATADVTIREVAL